MLVTEINMKTFLKTIARIFVGKNAWVLRPDGEHFESATLIATLMFAVPAALFVAAPAFVKAWGATEYLSFWGGLTLLLTYFGLIITMVLRNGGKFFDNFGLPQLDDKVRRRLGPGRSPQ